MRGAVIDLEGLDFDYPSRHGTLEEHLFTVEPGQVVAIVGPTGRGQVDARQSAAAVLRPDGGPVLARRSRHPQRDASHSLRDQISLVLQEPLLFAGTIADNIRYGRLDATDDEVVEAAKAANAHDFITRAARGLRHRARRAAARSSRAASASGSAIARAFLKDAPILILDEPTSSIDSQTEAVILDALDRLMVGRTTFMVAHRLSTVRQADLILVLERRRARRAGHARGADRARRSVPPALRDAVERAAAPKAPRSAGRSAPAAGVGRPRARVEPARRVLAARPKVVVLGMMSKIPVAGRGLADDPLPASVFERLGFDAYYVEAHARTPSMFMHAPQRRRPDAAAAFIAATMRRFGLATAGRSTRCTTTAAATG